MLPGPMAAILGNTNHDRLTPSNIISPTSAPRPPPSPRRHTEQLVGSAGSQFDDHTIPAEGDLLSDVDPAAVALADLASSRAHSPNSSSHANHHHHHPFMPPAGTKQAVPVDSLLGPSL